MTQQENISVSSSNHDHESHVLSENQVPCIKKPEPVSRGLVVASSLFVLITAYGFISERNRQKVVVQSSQPEYQGIKQDSLLNFYRNLRKDVEDRNEKAIQKFEANLGGIMSEFNAELDNIRQGFSSDISTYGNCSYLIYLMAYDKVNGSIPSHTDNFIHKELAKRLGPITGIYSKRMEDAWGELMEELYQNAFHYAMKTSQPGPENQIKISSPGIKNQEDFRVALHGLGMHTVVLTPLLGIDFYFVIKSKTINTILSMVGKIAARLFARPIAVATGSAVLVVSDGPLPIGDIIAVGGLLWTGYDIVTARSQFQTEISNSMENLNHNMVRQIQDEIQNNAKSLISSFKSFCDEIETSTIKRTLSE